MSPLAPREAVLWLGTAAVVAAATVLSAWGDQAAARAPIGLIHLANEGFLVEVGEHRVLIDALFREGVDGYATLTPATRRRLESAAPPFHDAAFVLATHLHADHFDADAVAAYLAASPATRFVSTPQAHTQLHAVATDADLLTRTDSVLPAEGRRETRTHRGVRVQVLNIHHGRSRSVENLGLLVEIGGYRLLHIGDSEATAADLRAAGIGADRLDVLFAPYWYFLGDDGRRALRESGARQIVAMHAGSPAVDSAIRRAGGFAALFATFRSAFPNAQWLERELQRLELQ